MLHIHDLPLRADSLCEWAFRIALEDTLERWTLARQFDLEGTAPLGCLSIVPAMQWAAPAVQVELLLTTWQRCRSDEPRKSTLLDECVLLGTFGTAVRVLTDLDDPLQLEGMPLLSIPAGWQLLADMHARLDQVIEGFRLLPMEVVADSPPEEAQELRRCWSIDESEVDEWLEALGRLRATPAIAELADFLPPALKQKLLGLAVRPTVTV